MLWLAVKIIRLQIAGFGPFVPAVDGNQRNVVPIGKFLGRQQHFFEISGGIILHNPLSEKLEPRVIIPTDRNVGEISKLTKREYLPADKKKTLAPAIEHMARNYYDSAITNQRLAALCGISTVYFRKEFERCHGVSPIRFLHNLRIQKAKAILRSDYESIEQVVFSVGYNSIYPFSKRFKVYTGQSPSEYAKTSR